MSRRADPTPILIRCDAGRDDGLGHLSRCLTLAAALNEAGSEMPVFLTHAPDGIGDDLIAARGFEWRDSPARAGTAADCAFVLETIETVSLQARTRPLVILDSKGIDADYALACGRMGVLVCLDDELLRDLPCSLLLNYNAWVGEESYPRLRDRRVLAGLDFNLVRPEFFVERRGGPAAARDLHVLVTLGGEDPGNHTLWVIKAFEDLLADPAVTLVIGPAHPEPGKVKQTAHIKLPHAEVVVAPHSMARYITGADIAITAGGTTCYELAAARVAQAAIIIEEHQAALVEALQGAGCLIVLGHGDDLDVERARSAFESLLTSAKMRQQQQDAAAALMPASGVKTVAKAVMDRYREAA